MSLKELEELLKPVGGTINVDVVFINVHNGDSIAQVFRNLGVP